MHKGDIIFIRDYRFHSTWETRDKFFIVLSDTEKYLDVIFVFTTSKTDKYSPLPEESKVIIPLGTFEFFPKETIVVVHNIHQVDRKEFESYAQENKGIIPAHLLSQIIEKVKKSTLVKPYIKRLL